MEKLAETSAAPPTCAYDKDYKYAVKKARIAKPQEMSRLTKKLFMGWASKGKWPTSLNEEIQRDLQDVVDQMKKR